MYRGPIYRALYMVGRCTGSVDRASGSYCWSSQMTSDFISVMATTSIGETNTRLSFLCHALVFTQYSVVYDPPIPQTEPFLVFVTMFGSGDHLITYLISIVSNYFFGKRLAGLDTTICVGSMLAKM